MVDLPHKHFCNTITNFSLKQCEVPNLIFFIENRSNMVKNDSGFLIKVVIGTVDARTLDLKLRSYK